MKYCLTVTETTNSFMTEIEPCSSHMESGAIVCMFGYRQWTVHKTKELAVKKEEAQKKDYEERMKNNGKTV